MVLRLWKGGVIPSAATPNQVAAFNRQAASDGGDIQRHAAVPAVFARIQVLDARVLQRTGSADEQYGYPPSSERIPYSVTVID
jgi:hypothetical protein